jgi:hypothetical protein
VLAVKDTNVGPAPGLGRLFDPGGERTLDDSITTAVGSLALRGSARCPVCGGTLTGAEEAGRMPAGDCGACGSRLD